MTNAGGTSVVIEAGTLRLRGDLGLPHGAKGVVLFAHGSGSGRFSPRNRFVAQTLQARGFATLLLDLLEEREAEDRRKVFDIDLLADRLLTAATWLRRQPSTAALPLGYFGASTGAGAALQAAARMPEAVTAVVSRGGRPDLAAPFLARVTAPTLLIVGGNDPVVVELNQRAYRELQAEKELVIVPGATHLFEEPGALEAVAGRAAAWFSEKLPSVHDLRALIRTQR
jgi:putative phosphoribosyl transferase